MKKIFSLALIGICLAFFSCTETFELDSLLDDPNNPTPETADLESLYSSAQLGFGGFLSSPQAFTMQLSRQVAFTAGNDYQTAFTPTNFDGIWATAYSAFLPDAKAVIDLAEPTGQLFHVGTSKIMQAYVLVTLVDLFGDVPFDEAGQGIDVISPSAQSGESVYAAAWGLANEGIADLTANEAAAPALDIMYGGSAAGWTAAANSLLMKIATNTRDFAAFDELVAAGGFISSNAGDWQFEYGSNREDPDSRHPLYVDSYETSDGDYQSNWMMWAMTEDKDNADPRARAYFNSCLLYTSPSPRDS